MKYKVQPENQCFPLKILFLIHGIYGKVFFNWLKGKVLEETEKKIL